MQLLCKHRKEKLQKQNVVVWNVTQQHIFMVKVVEPKPVLDVLWRCHTQKSKREKLNKFFFIFGLISGMIQDECSVCSANIFSIDMEYDII